MSAINDTNSQPAVFLLTTIPGLGDLHVWISILYCLVYVVSILGNSFILFIIKTDPRLHEPMYILLAMLAITDLGLSISTMPTTLAVFCFNSREISHDACFAQLLFISLLSYTESSILLCMAFDRFVAICNPLRYASILTLPRIVTMGLVSVLRGLILILPLSILLKQYHYCKSNILLHTYCLNHELMRMSCSEMGFNFVSGLLITVSSEAFDLLLILLSYGIILKTVLSITTHVERLKALNTCVSNICVILLFYVPWISLSVIYRLKRPSSPWLHIVMGNIYLLVPPLMNPIVYSMKTKPIQARLIKMFVK